MIEFQSRIGGVLRGISSCEEKDSCPVLLPCYGVSCTVCYILPTQPGVQYSIFQISYTVHFRMGEQYNISDWV